MGQDHIISMRQLESAPCPVIASIPHVQQVPKSRTRSRFVSLDQPATAAEMEVRPRTLQFHIVGVQCSKCVQKLESLPIRYPQLFEWCAVDLSRDLITVTRSMQSQYSELAEIIEGMGFRLDPVSRATNWQTLRSQENRREFIRLGVVAGLTGNIMLMAIAIYGGAGPDLDFYFRAIMTVLGIPVATWGAASIHRGAWLTLVRQKKITVDLPISLAILAGLAHSILSLGGLASGSYLDSVAMLVLLIQGSRTALRILRQKFDRQEDLLPDWMIATVETSDGKQVLARHLKIGDRFLLSSGQRSPVDCYSECETTEWDLSILSGESQPLATHPKVLIPAGAKWTGTREPEGNATLELVVAKPQIESRLIQLIQSWRDGSRERQGLSFLSDRAGETFVAAVLALAALLTLVPVEFLPGTSDQPGWLRALTLLIVTCPCVFAFAIPLAESIALLRLSRAGLLAKHSSVFRKVLECERVAVDKTGTLTTGHYQVDSFQSLETALDERQILSISFILQDGDHHPVARAIAQYCQSHLGAAFSLNRIALTDLKTLSSGGRSGKLDAITYSIKSIPSDLNQARFKSSVAAVVRLYQESQPIAEFQIRDEVRAGAKDLVRSLRVRGLIVQMLTGDHRRQAEIVGEAVGLNTSQIQSGLLPGDKARAVSLRPTLMIGDGVNDAEALQAAHLGLAIKGDFDACLESAEIVFTGTDLNRLIELFTTTIDLRSALKLSLGFALIFNLVNGTLAVLGIMNPLVAAVLMPVSSLLVTAISFFRLKTTGPSDGNR